MTRATGFEFRNRFCIGALLVAGSGCKLQDRGVGCGRTCRYVRHPLYFSNVLMTLSMALMASRTGWFVIVVGMIVFQYRLWSFESLGGK